MKMYAKMEELGPIGGGVHPAHPSLDPPMLRLLICVLICVIYGSYEALLLNALKDEVLKFAKINGHSLGYGMNRVGVFFL